MERSSSRGGTLRRYYFEESSFQGDILVIENDRFQHIVKVCRQGLGHQFEALTPDGLARKVEVVELDSTKKRALAKILSQRNLPPLKKPHIKLCLSYPKRETFNRVLVKAVELGVHSLHGFPSEFSARGGWVKSLDKKNERFNKIVEGAIQQSGRGAPFPLHFHNSLDGVLKAFRDSEINVGILAFEGEGVLPLKPVFKRLKQAQDFEEIWLFVGGEGGFSAEDLKIFSNYNIIPFGFGEQVLRVETACVAVLGVLKYLLDHYS